MASRRNYQADSKDNSKAKSYKGKNQYKGKSKSDKTKSKDMEVDRITNAEGNNNPSWYIPNKEVMDQATRFSFDNFIGVPTSFDPQGSISGLTDSTVNLGAIMQVMLNPSPGYTPNGIEKTAAVNQQAFRMYARLSSINAKNTYYTPNDIVTMFLAMGELISMISLAQRAYGLLWTYNVRNRTMPTTLVDVAGVKAESLRAQAAPFLIRLNTALVEANKIPIPSNIDYFARCAQIYSSVYKDSESDMCELYVPIPYSTWDLDESGHSDGTQLLTHVLYGTSAATYAGMEPNDLLDIIEEKIDTMLTSATYNYVYSDIINLVSKDAGVQLLQFSPIDWNYTVFPVHDREWLLKINNAAIMGPPLATGSQFTPDNHTNENDVIPNIDSLCMFFKPQWRRTIPDMGFYRPLNFTNDAPSLEERITAIRYANMASLSLDSGYYYTGQKVALTDHYVVKILIYTESVDVKDFTLAQNSILNSSSEASILTRFSYHPYIFKLSGTAGDYVIEGVIGDFDYWTLVDYETLQKIDKLSLFALFDNKDITKVYD